MIGKIHSIESFGTVDGPGIRLVVFLQGCPMRCKYCHNPDTWEMTGGLPLSVNEILKQYEAAKEFYQHGGITATGGEPLMQTEFVTELFTAAGKLGIHTCLDTSGITFHPEDPASLVKMEQVLEVTDLVLLDLKHINPMEHAALCGHRNDNILAFAKYLDQKKIPVWIRHVVVPGITLREPDLYELGQFIGTLTNVKALDVLPYHDMGKVKYQQLGIPYSLEDVKPLSTEDAVKAKEMILHGIREKRQNRET